MTTLALKDGVFAADTAMSRGGTTLLNVTKITQRDDGCMAGVCGSGSYIGPFMAWFLGGEEGECPRAKDDNDSGCSTGIIVRLDGTVEVHETGGWYLVEPAPYFALGSGRDAALGAMFAGADAETAVRAAITHDHGTGGEVTVLRLPTKPRLVSAA